MKNLFKKIFGRKTTSTDTDNLIGGVIPPSVYDLIIEYEVGGKSYYNKRLAKPTYPGGASGVTIGIGYDLGYKNHAQFKNDWGDILDAKTFSRLDKQIGKKRDDAKAAVSSLRDIKISWNDAEKVFRTVTLPRFVQRTKRAFPGSANLHPVVFGVLVSLVFNRGGSMRGGSRKEMAAIRDIIASGKADGKTYKQIASEIRSMKRLWRNKGLDGLLKRRDAEAKLIDSVA